MWRPAGKGGYRTIATTHTGALTGYLTATVHLPGTGFVKLSWTSASGITMRSRASPGDGALSAASTADRPASTLRCSGRCC